MANRVSDMVPAGGGQRRVVGRLAPSPTGALHVGNARSFLLAWLSVRQQGGRIHLRIEDIDSPRVKPWALEATLEDLAWLGLDCDPYPTQRRTSPRPVVSSLGPAEGATWLGLSDDGAMMIQSRRMSRYAEVLEWLRQAGAVYRCTCTRSDVATAASAPHEEKLPPLEGVVYPGTCRHRDAVASIDNERYSWRFRIPPKHLVWYDGTYGKQSAHLARQLGDFVVAKSDETPAYQLAVVVDDFDSGVTEVVRGADLIPSTFRQLALLERLGWSPPRYYHVPLVVGPDGKRLAKRHGDTRLATLRKQGVKPEMLVGYLAWTLGLIPDRRPCAPEELVGSLDWSRLPTEPTVFELSRELPMLLSRR